MQLNYTEEDTERARQQERAGQPVQPAPTPSMQGTWVPPFERKRRFNALALALIGLGVMMLGNRLLPNMGEIQGSMVLFTISACFLFFSLSQRIFGLLIPGAILAGIGLGIPFADLTNGASVLWGLAGAFLSIAVLGRGLFNVRSSWAMIPAVILFGIGLIPFMLSLPGILGIGAIIGPILLVAAGWWLGWGRGRGRI